MLKRVGTIWYPFNAKGLQEKPIFEDEFGLWVGKYISPIAIAHERLAFLLHYELEFTSFLIPPNKVITLNGQEIFVTRFIHDAIPYRRPNSSFQHLTRSEREIGLMARLMADIDGNFNNLLKDQAGRVWSLDYELGGEFDEYEEPLRNRNYGEIFDRIGYFMIHGETPEDLFQAGIARIRTRLDSGQFQRNHLRTLCIKAGIPRPELDRYVSGIWATLIDLQAKMALIIEVWQEILDNQENQNDISNSRKQHGISPAAVTVEFFERPKITTAEFDRPWEGPIRS